MPTVAVALETYQREDFMLENTLASVVPTVKACYIALGTYSMRLTSGLVYGFHAGELYSIFGLKRGVFTLSPYRWAYEDGVYVALC